MAGFYDDVSVGELVQKLATRVDGFPALEFLTEDPTRLKFSKLSEVDSFNMVSLIESDDGEDSAILKYGIDKFTLAGQEITVSLDRQVIEYNGLCLLDELMPGYVPKPYCHNRDVNIIAMEYLSGMELVGPIVRRGEMSSKLGSRIGHALGRMHLLTHKNYMEPEQWEQLQKNHWNDFFHMMFKLIRFGKKFEENNGFTFMPEGGVDTFREGIKEIKEKNILPTLITKLEKRLCLTHRDSHINSIMVNENRLAFIDFELAMPGNPAYDLGVFLANFAFGVAEAEVREDQDVSDIRKKAREMVKNLMEAYLKVFEGRLSMLGGSEEFISEVTAFTGSSLFQLSTFKNLHQIAFLSDAQKVGFLKHGHGILSVYPDITTIDKLIDIAFPL